MAEALVKKVEQAPAACAPCRTQFYGAGERGPSLDRGRNGAGKTRTFTSSPGFTARTRFGDGVGPRYRGLKARPRNLRARDGPHLSGRKTRTEAMTVLDKCDRRRPARPGQCRRPPAKRSGGDRSSAFRPAAVRGPRTHQHRPAGWKGARSGERSRAFLTARRGDGRDESDEIIRPPPPPRRLVGKLSQRG